MPKHSAEKAAATPAVKVKLLAGPKEGLPCQGGIPIIAGGKTVGAFAVYPECGHSARSAHFPLCTDSGHSEGAKADHVAGWSGPVGAC